MISKQEYQAQAAQGYNRIPLVQELLADLDTPLSIYLKLANKPFTYLLESVVGGERFGRYLLLLAAFSFTTLTAAVLVYRRQLQTQVRF